MQHLKKGSIFLPITLRDFRMFSTFQQVNISQTIPWCTSCEPEQPDLETKLDPESRTVGPWLMTFFELTYLSMFFLCFLVRSLLRLNRTQESGRCPERALQEDEGLQAPGWPQPSQEDCSSCPRHSDPQIHPEDSRKEGRWSSMRSVDRFWDVLEDLVRIL